MTAVSDKIREADVVDFERDGAVCLRGLFETAWLDRIQAGIEKDMAEPGPLYRIVSGEDDPGLFFADHHMWQRWLEFRAFVHESPAGEIAVRLLRSHRINFYFDALWIKEPGTAEPSVWHQDQPYYNVDGRQTCVIWLPLDLIDAETSLQLVRGSHNWGRWFSPESFGQGVNERGMGSGAKFETIPDIDAGDHEYLVWAVEPGDCVAFHGLTVHGARGNRRRDRRRRALTTHWLGDDTVFAGRPYWHELEIEHYGLKPGDPMDCDFCPRVWPKPI